MARGRRIFKLMPRAGKTAQLKAMYAKITRYLTNNIYSITPGNYNPKEAKLRLLAAEAKIRTLTHKVIDWFAPTIESTYRLAKIKVIRKLERIGKKPSRSVNHQKIIDNQLRRIDRTIVKANRSMLTQAKGYLKLIRTAQREFKDAKLQELSFNEIRYKEDVRNIIQDAQLLNQTRQEVQRELKGYFKGRFGTFDYIEINGRSYKPSYYAEMVARTELRRAQSEAVIGASKEYGSDLVKFSSHFHARPDYEAVDPCAPLEEQVFSISGKSDKYPQLTEYETPPIHPNCMHHLDPWDEILEN